jgi:hypothetical protein
VYNTILNLGMLEVYLLPFKVDYVSVARYAIALFSELLVRSGVDQIDIYSETYLAGKRRSDTSSLLLSDVVSRDVECLLPTLVKFIQRRHPSYTLRLIFLENGNKRNLINVIINTVYLR